MSIHITLTPEEERKLAELARVRGKDPAAHAHDVVAAYLNGADQKAQSRSRRSSPRSGRGGARAAWPTATLTTSWSWSFETPGTSGVGRKGRREPRWPATSRESRDGRQVGGCSSIVAGGLPCK